MKVHDRAFKLGHIIMLRCILLVLVSIWPVLAMRSCFQGLQKECSSYDREFSACLCAADSTREELCCDLNGRSGVISHDSVRFFGKVVVRDAENLDFYPDCNNPQNITFINIKNGSFKNQVGVAPVRCPTLVDVRDSFFKNFWLINGLTLFKAQVNAVGWATDFTHIRMDNSTVNLLSNFSVSNPGWIKRECFTMQHSLINEAVHINVACDVIMENTVLKSIQHSRFSRSRITNSTFEKVPKYGLTFLRGWHRMREVTFTTLAKESLIFAFQSDVSIVGLKILKCEMPCITIEGGFIHATNVSISGELIPNFLSSGYVKHVPSEEFRMVRTTDVSCRAGSSKLVCDLGAHDTMPVVFLPTTEYAEILVMKHHNLGIFTNCYKHLAIKQVIGYVREEGSYQATTVPFIEGHLDGTSKILECDEVPKTLYIEDCKLRFLHAADLEELVVTKAEVGSVEVKSPMNYVKFDYAEIHYLENVEYFKDPQKKSMFEMSDVLFTSIYGLYLRSGGILSYCRVQTKIANLTLNLSLPTDSLLIKTTHIERIPENGITIVRGILIFDEVTIVDLEADAINIQHGGKLVVSGALDPPKPLGCSEFAPSIVVQSRYQVVFIGAPTPSWLWNCVKVMPDAKFEVDIEQGYVNLKPSDCELDSQYQYSCEAYTGRGAILGGNNNFAEAREVSIKGGHRLIVKEHCLDELKIYSVPRVKIAFVDTSCFHKLEVHNSSVNKLWNNVFAAKVTESRIIDFRPTAELEQTLITSSKMDTIRAGIRNGVFNGVDINTVESMSISSNLTMIHTLIDTLLESSISISYNAILTIDHSSISNMNIKCITVFGNLTILNSVIHHSVNGSIVVHPDSHIHLENVTISSQVPHIISMEGPANFVLKNIHVKNRTMRGVQKLTLVNENLEVDADVSKATLPPLNEDFPPPNNENSEWIKLQSNDSTVPDRDDILQPEEISPKKRVEKEVVYSVMNGSVHDAKIFEHVKFDVMNHDVDGKSGKAVDTMDIAQRSEEAVINPTETVKATTKETYAVVDLVKQSKTWSAENLEASTHKPMHPQAAKATDNGKTNAIPTSQPSGAGLLVVFLVMFFAAILLLIIVMMYYKKYMNLRTENQTRAYQPMALGSRSDASESQAEGEHASVELKSTVAVTFKAAPLQRETSPTFAEDDTTMAIADRVNLVQ
ncbi:uncharacterized protein LOC108669985 [Hyalella azteca]|uniref:Uncharacterized protein LOC108669985 n=1 Tax=Hyalella azteca TaxID=294128 RepID=A0A8B7NHS0_HYAAZ|nr:uncharacterized protein LOC108669985 [Hyalella azteca]